MQWRRIIVHSEPEQEEIVTNILLESGAQGVAVSGSWEDDISRAGEWDYVDGLAEVPYSVEAYYGADDERVTAKISWRLEAALGAAPRVEAETVDDADWMNAWKEFFGPVRAGDHLVVKPTWSEYDAYPGDIVVEIDPGMAFGAGGHETTRMSLRLIEQFLYPGETVIDVGSGSGVLAIAAAKLGASVVYALEADPVAADVARENAAANGADAVQVEHSDLLAALPAGMQADMVVANIIADVIIRLIPELDGVLRQSGMFICSGIIDSRLDDVLEVLRCNALRPIVVESDGEWRSVAAKRKE